ncbi:MAG: flagellar biosynthetic protein FliR [Selenomonadaceae bacterium]|nr:flagellar biosynthetic protein FliR [Selenomonadaceae bacterium]
MDFFDLLQNHAAVFLLLLTRITGIFIISPFFGSQNIPITMRVATAMTIAVVIFPVVDQHTIVEAPASVLSYGLSVLSELFIGWLIGLVSYVALISISMAGKIMDLQVGYAMVQVMDPTSGQQNALIGSFLYNLAVIIFLVTDGHHFLLSGLVESFQMIPITGLNLDTDIVDLMVDFTYGIFVSGMKVAIPVTFAILLTNVGLGILARTMPQLNIFVVGVPMHLVIGTFVLAMLIPFYVVFLDVLFNEMYGNITIALRAIQ